MSLARTATFIEGWHSVEPLALSVDSAVIGNIFNLDTAELADTVQIAVDTGVVVPTHTVSLAPQQLLPLDIGIAVGSVLLTATVWGTYAGGVVELRIPIVGAGLYALRVFLPDTAPSGADTLYIAIDGSVYSSASMGEASFLCGRALTSEIFYGVDVRVGGAINVAQVKGYKYQQVYKELKRQLAPLIDVENDEVYKVVVGAESNAFAAVRATSSVTKAFLPQVAAPTAEIIPTHPTEIDRPLGVSPALCADANRYDTVLVLLDGMLAYQGSANAELYTRAIVDDAVPTEGYIAIAASQENGQALRINIDRITLTFDYQRPLSGDPAPSIIRTLALPKDYELHAGDVLYFDAYGSCYSDYRMTAETFLAGFVIEESALFAEGAISNELELLDQYSRKICTEFLIQNADGYELDALGRQWFGISRRVGESDENYTRRLVAAVTGLSATRYALDTVLRMFSPNYVNIQEGLTQGIGYFGSSFFNMATTFPAPTGAFTAYAASAHFAQNYGGRLFILITLEKSDITDNPINGKFIYDLVAHTVAAGVGFVIYVIEM